MLVDILNNFLNFFHLRGSAYQSYIGYITGGDFSILYAAIQFAIVNKIIQLTFIKSMFRMKHLKQFYVAVNLLFIGILLTVTMTASVFTILLVDILTTIMYSINNQLTISGVSDLYLMSNLNRKRGLSSLTTFVVGMIVAVLLKNDLPMTILYFMVGITVVTMLVVLKKWNIEVEEKKEKQKKEVEEKKKYEVDTQVTTYMLSGVFMSISSVFDLYYVQKTLENGYSLSYITTLASVGALISGVGFLYASRHYFEMERLRNFITVSRLSLGLFPFLVLLNFPFYPVVKVIIFGLDGFIISIYQSLFLASRDKRSLVFMSTLRGTVGYATFSGAAMLVQTGLFSLWVLAGVSLTANIVSAVLLKIMKERGFKFLNAQEKAIKNYNLIGTPVVLVHHFKNTRSKVGEVGTVKGIRDSKVIVQMDNGELIKSNVHSFGLLKFATIRQLIYSYDHLNAIVLRIKIGNKFFTNPENIYGRIDPDSTIIVEHRLLSDGTMEILNVDRRSLLEKVKGR